MLAYLTANLWLTWVIIALVCLVMELSSGDFYVTCFAIGAVAAAVFSALGTPVWLQVVIFAVASVLSLWLIRPALVKRLHRSGEERVSNADALIGRIGEVTEAIAAGGYGRVRIDGDYWKAESTATSDIAVGEKVKVVKRESIIITVERA